MQLNHLVLMIDEGMQAMSLVDTGTSHFHWTLALGDAFPLARDLQRLDERRVLVGFDRGFLGRQLFQFDAGGRLLGTWSAPERISSLQGLLVITSRPLQ